MRTGFEKFSFSFCIVLPMRVFDCYPLNYATCSELHPSVDFPSEMKVDDHKSDGSLAEGNSCLPQKSKCTASEPGFGVENVSLNVKIDEDVKSGVVGNNTMGPVPSSCTKVKL